MILEELDLPYETSWVEAEDLKKEPYESVNPNGRVPDMPAAPPQRPSVVRTPSSPPFLT